MEKQSTVFHLLWYKRANNVHFVLLCSWLFFFFFNRTHTEMTDFSLTSVCLQSNTTHSICIYVKNVRLNFFFIVCSVCFFFLLFSGVLFDHLFYANEFHCLFKCHTPKEREKKKTAVRAGSLFLFLLFDCLPPFCLVLYHCFCYFSSFLVRYVLVENRPAQTHGSIARCSFAFMVSIDAVDGARGAIQLELPSWIRKIARYITYDLNLWLFQIFKTKAVLIIAFLFGIGNVSGAHVWLFRFQWNFKLGKKFMRPKIGTTIVENSRFNTKMFIAIFGKGAYVERWGGEKPSLNSN